MILLSALHITLIHLVFLTVCGIGLARLVLPQRLQGHQLTLAPTFGLALVAIIGFYGTHAGFTIRQLLPITIGIALLLLIIATVDAYRAGEWWWVDFLPPRELLAVGSVMAGAWLLNILPVLSYGTLVPIGENWDIEFYLPLADYLQSYSYSSLVHAPANPLRDLLLTDRLASRAMGATYAQSMGDILTFREAWDSWVPMLGLFRALSIAGFYAFLRDGLGFQPRGALAGGGLITVNSLLLWTTYNSFGMGLGGLVLLPTSLLCLIVALRSGQHRTAIGAIVLLGGLTCTYWPMLMVYGLLGAGIGVVIIWEQWKDEWVRVVGRGMLILIGGGIVGFLAHLHALDAFLGVFTLQTPSMGVSSFLSPAAIIGSAPYHHQGVAAGWGNVGIVLAWGGVGIMAGLLFLTIRKGTSQRPLTLTIVACTLFYLIALRFIVGFPYGYLRGASYINSFLIGIAGASVIMDTTRLSRFIPALYATLLLISATAGYRTYAVYVDEPGMLHFDTVRMRAAAGSIAAEGDQQAQQHQQEQRKETLPSNAPSDSVFISPNPVLRGPYTGALAYAFRKHDLVGMMATGYRSLAHVPPDTNPAYGVLANGDDPRAYGFTESIWRGDRATLYRAPTGRVAWLNGRPSFYTEDHLLLDDTVYTRAKLGIGSHLEATPDSPLTLYIGHHDIDDEPIEHDASEREKRAVELMIGSFVEQKGELMVGGDAYPIALSSGVNTLTIPTLETPTVVSLRGEDAPLYLRWASMLDAPLESELVLEPTGISPTSTTATNIATFDDTLLLGVSNDVHQEGANIEVAAPGGDVVRLAVEIYEELAGYGGNPAHYAWTAFPVANAKGNYTLDIDLQTPAMQLNGEPLMINTGEMRDGSYFAALWVYQGEHVRRTIPFLRFTREHGEIRKITPLDVNCVFAPLSFPRHTHDAQFGDGIKLLASEQSTVTVHPQDEMQVSLLWQAEQSLPTSYLVFVQLLGEGDHKIAEWNGAAGGDWYPTIVWQVGQRMWQDIPLAIAADAQPGHYRTIVGLFDPVSGERLHLQDGSPMMSVGEVEVVERETP